MKTTIFLPIAALVAATLVGCDPRVDKKTFQKLDGTWEIASVVIRERLAPDGTALPDTVIVNPAGEIKIDFCNQDNDCPITETLTREEPVPHIFTPTIGKNPTDILIERDPLDPSPREGEGIEGGYFFRFSGEDALTLELKQKTSTRFVLSYRGRALNLNLVRKE